MMTEDWQRRSGAIVLVGIAVLLLLLTGRLLYINSVLGPRLRMLAAKQHGGELVIPARRGTIYDCRGRVLATSRQQPDVFVDPLYVDDVDSLAGELGARLALPTSDIAGKIRSRSRHRFVVIARGVDDATTESISSLRSPAVGLVDRAVRAYPLGESLAPVLGIVGRDGHGLEGIELLHDKHLNGHDGRRSTVVDARRRALRQAQEGGTSPIDGGHVVLTIDAEIQRITFEALKEGVADFEAQSGLAVVTSPGNGHVLAMVNVSSRDSSATIATRAPPRRNRVVTDPVEPGSTFKPFVACGALEGGFVTTEELIDCGMGSHRFGKRVVSDVSPHGMLSVLEIVSKSSNIG
ncbi:MAG: peptidoglycan D,D-transpeptidase FtsI family protein, partial [Phycisphaerae bacterium]